MSRWEFQTYSLKETCEETKDTQVGNKHDFFQAKAVFSYVYLFASLTNHDNLRNSF